MATLDDAVQTQSRNIEKNSGKSIDEWVALVKASGNDRHTDIVAWLKSTHGFSHGNANFVALAAKHGPIGGDDEDRVGAIYSGPKAALRPFHDRVIETVGGFGPDIELAPKQAYVALRRSKQFATIGPGPRGTLEIGLNLGDVKPAGRLETTTGMCSHRVRLSSPEEFDAEVEGWLREAYARA